MHMSTHMSMHMSIGMPVHMPVHMPVPMSIHRFVFDKGCLPDKSLTLDARQSVQRHAYMHLDMCIGMHSDM